MQTIMGKTEIKEETAVARFTCYRVLLDEAEAAQMKVSLPWNTQRTPQCQLMTCFADAVNDIESNKYP